MYFDENKFIINNGRNATTCGLIGLLVGLLISIIFSFSLPVLIFFTLFISYLFLSGFWGAYRLNIWFKKYNYRMPDMIWQLLRVVVVIIGAILGILGWGFFEHFILLLSLSTAYPNISGLMAAQIILLPVLGKRYSKYIKFNDGH